MCFPSRITVASSYEVTHRRCSGSALSDGHICDMQSHQNIIDQPLTVQKHDPFDRLRDTILHADVLEDKIPSARMARQDGRGVIGYIHSQHIVHDGRKDFRLVRRVLRAPGAPTFPGRHQIHRDDVVVLFPLLAQKTRLGGDVLDVVMPVVPLLHAFSGRPFDGVPVGKGVENDLCRPVFVHLPGSVYRDAHVGITVVQMGDATIREGGVRCFLGGEGREQPRGSREREKQAFENHTYSKYCCCSID